MLIQITKEGFSLTGFLTAWSSIEYLSVNFIVCFSLHSSLLFDRYFGLPCCSCLLILYLHSLSLYRGSRHGNLELFQVLRRPSSGHCDTFFETKIIYERFIYCAVLQDGWGSLGRGRVGRVPPGGSIRMNPTGWSYR